MTGLLNGCRAKIARSEELIGILKEEINAFMNSDPGAYSTTRKMTDNQRNYIFIAKANQPIPEKFSILAGEIAHHLASSLDHLFSALVIRNGETLTRKQYFPVYVSSSEFNSPRVEKMLADISKSARDKVSALQPFHSPTPADTILAALKEINNTDKHRILISISGSATFGETLIIGDGNPVFDIHGNPPSIIGLSMPKAVPINEVGNEFFRISLAEPTPEFEAEIKLVANVSFIQLGLTDLAPVIEALTAMLGGVVHTINEFSGEFDTDD